MKKFLVLLLTFLLVFSALSLVSCSGKDDTPKLGLGVYSSSVEGSDAEGDESGSAKASVTLAAIIVSADGRVEKCLIDVAESAVGFTASGKAVLPSGFKTKGELGDDYNMKAAGAKLEWYEQRDAFVRLVEGKSLREIKALVADGGKGNENVVSAGCTIVISDFVKAIISAFENAEGIENYSDGLTLDMKISTDAEATDAGAGSDGKITVRTQAAAMAMKDSIKVASAEKNASFEAVFDASGNFKGK